MTHSDNIDVLLDQLCQALEGPPSETNFASVCQFIDRVSWLDQQRALAEAVPLTAGKLSSWPDAVRILPSSWAIRWLEGDLPGAMAVLGRALRFEEYACLRDDDVDALVELIRLVSPVKLDVNVSELGGASFHRLFKSPEMGSITSLCLRGGLGVEGAERLAKVDTLTSLKTLTLLGGRLSEDCLPLFEGAQWAPGLEELHLSSLRGMSPIAECANLCEGLKSFAVNWGSFSREDCEAFASAPGLASLEHLHLDDCGIKNDGLLALIASGYLSNLETLSVVNNGLGSKSINRLASSKLIEGVRRLRIGDNPIKAGGLKKLAKSPCLHALEELNIYDFDDDLGGVFLDALAQNLAVTSLRKLEANNNAVTDEQGKALLERADLGQLEYLEGSSWRLKPETWRALLSSKLGRNISHLDIANTELIDEHGSIFDDMPETSRIRFFRYETWEESEGRGALLSLPPFRELEELELEVVSLSEATEAFCKPPLTDSIRALRVDVGGISEESIIELLKEGRLNNIEELKLDRCELTERTIDALIDAKHIRNLRHISLWKNHGIGDAAARLFNSHHMRSLREIYLNTVQLSGEALARELGQLDFDAPLETLGVQSNAIGDEGALALANTPHLKSLSTYYLYGCKIGEEGVMALANSPNVKRISVLHLGNDPGSEEGRKALLESPYLPERIKRAWAPESDKS